MPLTIIQKKEIDTLISSKIENKLKNYGRETTSIENSLIIFLNFLSERFIQTFKRPFL